MKPMAESGMPLNLRYLCLQMEHGKVTRPEDYGLRQAEGWHWKKRAERSVGVAFTAFTDQGGVSWTAG